MIFKGVLSKISLFYPFEGEMEDKCPYICKHSSFSRRAQQFLLG